MDTTVAENPPLPPAPEPDPNTLGGRLALGLKTFREMPVGRQIALIGTLAGGLVAVVAILVWALSPTYAPLFGQIDPAEASEVMKALDKLGVPYRVDNGTGQIQVPQQRIAETRLQLAGEGLPKSADIGFELLQQESGFGTSRLIEGARYQRALEGELARSIAALEPVDRARVHIAKAERSVFVRERIPPSASVVVHLKGREELTDAQINAIVHLVSSSVPELVPERVTVVDQRGRLLTANTKNRDDQLTLDQLEYIHRIESRYIERAESLLAPIVGGRNRVRVQVTADLDFSRVERTQEAYDPERTAVRSEQLNEEERRGADPLVGGIPGALTNQPPAGGVIGQQQAQPNNQMPSSRSQQTTRNYEISRTLAHIQETPGSVRRLTAAVVVDYADQVNEAGEPVRVPRSEAELETLRKLVRDAIGLNEARGDSLQVSSAPFVPEPEEAGEPIWTQPWFLELVKIIGGLLLALIVMLTVVKPALNQILPKPPEPEEEEEAGEGVPALTDETARAGEAAAEGEEGAEGEEIVSLTHEPSSIAALIAPKGLDRQQLDIEAVRELVRQDPKRVVQVMKQWLAEDGN